MRIFALFYVLALLSLANSYSYAGHAISGDASKQIADAIRAEM